MTLEVVTFGCRLNAYESEAIKNRASEAQLRGTLVVNTCAVTQEAVRQSRQAIRKFKRENPARRIIVTGCAAQVEPKTYAGMPEVDAVFGNAEKLTAAAYADFGIGGSEKIRVNDIMSVRDTAPQMVDHFDGKTRAFLQVQNGCDHRCTFCIIPYGRGNSRSVPLGAVVTEARRLVEKGFPEIVLTGVDLTSYGADLPASPSLGMLVEKILRLVPELKRLRLSSLDAIEADPVLMRVIAEEERLMPHFHLSAQSGDDMILKRMKRRHSRARAVDLVARLKALRPGLSIGADLIAGFPTEDEAMFANTHRLIDECGIVFAHIFPYSPRPGTPAARMPQVDRPVIRARAAMLREAGLRVKAAWLKEQVGSVQDVLIELDGASGHAANFARVALPAAAPNTIVPVRIAAVEGDSLVGVPA